MRCWEREDYVYIKSQEEKEEEEMLLRDWLLLPLPLYWLVVWEREDRMRKSERIIPQAQSSSFSHREAYAPNYTARSETETPERNNILSSTVTRAAFQLF